MVQRLLATDLDGTFIDDPHITLGLWHDLIDREITVAFATGRHLSSVLAFYDALETGLRADACVLMVGTEIWRLEGGAYVIDDAWTERIARAWDEAAVRAAAGGIVGLVPQPDEWQSPLKCSFYYSGDHETVELLSGQVAASGVAAKVVVSAGSFVDVLPVESGKGKAVAFLAESLGIAPTAVVTAGDTGNDLDMMSPDLGFRSIVVGNASEELLGLDDQGIYHADGPRAAGIREGLAHFGWL